jgi:hypothetical protein
MIFKGRVWKFGDNIDTDVIIPARFLNVSDKEELAKKCFADLRPDFARGGPEQATVIVGEELRLRFFEGARTSCHQGQGYQRRGGKELCKDFLSQCLQRRSPAPGAGGGT